MSWHSSITEAELLAKGVAGVEIDGLRIALYALDGEVFATGNICTHAFALLSEGHVEGGCVECPLHQGLFDIRTGKAQGAPVTKDLATYPAKVEDGLVWVDTEPAAAAGGEAPAAAAAARRSDSRRLVIAGAGQAGAETARAARAEGFGGEIVLIGAERHPPYERPPLSKDLLLGRTTLAEAHVFDSGEAERLGIALRLGTAVTAIDREARRVTLGDGTELGYDLLVLATGAGARRLSLPGAEDRTVHYLRDAADAERLGPALRAATQVAVIGGGFIGLEIASAARALGKKVTVIEAQDRLLKRLLPSEAGEFLAWVAGQNDVALYLGTAIAGVSPEGVTLADGRLIEADLILAGIGASPNDALAREAGLPLGGCRGGCRAPGPAAGRGRCGRAAPRQKDGWRAAAPSAS